MGTPVDEFALIRRYFEPLAPASEGVVLGIGDDAALLSVPPGHELVVTTDTLVAGRHFPLDTAPFDIGWKSLAVNLSDLAAMGAEPRWITLALTLEKTDPDWLAEFSRGLGELARQHRVALVGGDTTRGPLSISLTAMGVVPGGRALRRDGARVGDAVCVTGTLGDAALALQYRLSTARVAGSAATSPEADQQALRSRLDRPQARVSAGLLLRDYATAAIDLSDGLAGDLSHVLRASGVGAVIEAQRLPMSAEFERLAPPASRLAFQACGGDDYELCLCIPLDRFEAARAQLDVPLTVIGRIREEPGLRFIGDTGATIEIAAHGYRHFE